jgi:hypothetical protein
MAGRDFGAKTEQAKLRQAQGFVPRFSRVTGNYWPSGASLEKAFSSIGAPMSYRSLLITGAFLSLFSGALHASNLQFRGYNFNAYVLKSDGMRYREFPQNGKSMLKVQADEEYSIVIRNPLPVQAAVAVTIDGLNSIDGKRATPKNSKKWIIGPNATLSIEGWQTGGQTLRRFVFTHDASSYAQWQENRTGKPLTRNLGVIGVAWFWNKEELDAALHPPQPFENEYSSPNGTPRQASRGKSAASPAYEAQAGSAVQDKAGTGMGRQEYNAVTQVEFNSNAGMFSVGDVMKIYYEFAKEAPEPAPFINEGEENDRFAPEMPQ